MITAITSHIEDQVVREVLEDIIRQTNEQIVLRGKWKFLIIDVSGAVTNKKIRHNLDFKPVDIIQTYKSGAGSITYNTDSFDATTIDVTTTGAVSVRLFVGRYSEET